MQTDISKVCADFLRSQYSSASDVKLKATHARELIAAYFGYKSHAALLADKAYPVHQLVDADVLVPNVKLMEGRRNDLADLPKSMPSSKEIASQVSDFLQAAGHFGGKVWLYDSLEEYVMEVLLHDEDALITDQLGGVMAETNAYFDEAIYDSAEVIDGDDVLTVDVVGQYNGTSDQDRMFCGDQIDMEVTVELSRVAGRTAFLNPDISATGSVNDDWVDPDLR